ncbi:MAG: hypothetical protein ACNI25_14485 [Halarcobacter sp.]
MNINSNQNLLFSSINTYFKDKEPKSTLNIKSEEVETSTNKFTVKKQGDYSTYSATDLRNLSYEEVKENYDELKEIIENRLKNSPSSDEEMKKFQEEKSKEALKDVSPFDIDKRSEILINLGKEYLNKNKNLDNENLNLMAFKKQLEKIDYLDNESYNKTLYDEIKQITNPFLAILHSDITKNNIEAVYNDKNKDSKAADSLAFGIYIGSTYVKASDINFMDTTKEKKEETLNKDYSTNSIKELKLLSNEELKQNYDELKEIVKESLKNKEKLSQKDKEELLDFNTLLEKVNISSNKNFSIYI